MSRVDDREEIGIGGFTAIAYVRQLETITANIPATPLEDGSLAHDHIILNPVQLDIEGRVSDIFLKPNAFVTAFKRNFAAIGNITKYLPARTQTQINRVSELVLTVDNYTKKIDAVISDGRQALEFFGSKDSAQSLKDKFLEMLDGYYNSRTLMRIEIRGKVYENMFITSRVITRDNTAIDNVNFRINAQELRFAEVIYQEVQQNYSNPSSGAVSEQVKGQENKGLNDAPGVGAEQEESLLSSISGLF